MRAIEAAANATMDDPDAAADDEIVAAIGSVGLYKALLFVWCPCVARYSPHSPGIQTRLRTPPFTRASHVFSQASGRRTVRCAAVGGCSTDAGTVGDAPS